jgi:hypothetical protein|tara:strand:- start:974 stop:1393 length:420 start_codon:yes stop_codon:yes gene_type:complete
LRRRSAAKLNARGPIFGVADIEALAPPEFSDLHQQRFASSPALIRPPQTQLHQGELRAAIRLALQRAMMALSQSGEFLQRPAEGVLTSCCSLFLNCPASGYLNEYGFFVHLHCYWLMASTARPAESWRFTRPADLQTGR